MRPQLTHLGIYVRDIAAMVDFYSSVLGLQVTDKGIAKRYAGAPQLIFMSASPEIHHQLVLMEWPSDAAAGRSNVNQISFKIDSLDELRRLYTVLQEKNVAPITPINHGNAMSLYSSDPEGNGLEIYMDLPWYVSQPHGDKLDLTLSNEELMRQTEEMVKEDPTFLPKETWAQNFMQHPHGKTFQ